MIGYFLHLNHIIKIDVDDYYFKPMRNQHFAKYTSRHFKVLGIKSLDGQIKKEINKDINKDIEKDVGVYRSLAYYAREVDYYSSEQQILDSLPKENGFIRLYYDSGNIKEKYFVKDGEIVECTHHLYKDE